MTVLGEILIESAKEAVAIARGEKRAARCNVPPDIDVRAIRRTMKLTQDDFASAYGFTVNQIRDWEQRRARPLGGVRAYLILIQKYPAEVRKLLAKTVDREKQAA